MKVLKIQSLCAGYGTFKVLFDINMEVPKKEITVIVGPNGAGKTTLLNSITRLATIHSGDIIYEDRSISDMPPYKIAKMGISYVPQLGNVFANLTVAGNLRIAGYTLNREELKSKIDEALELFPVLKEFMYRKAGTLSGGERRMLALAMGLVRKPNLMLLDEMSGDLAPIIAKKVIEKIVKLRDDMGMTILLVEQAAKRALEVGDRAYLLVSGGVKFSGRSEELLHHKELAKLYLGIR